MSTVLLLLIGCGDDPASQCTVDAEAGTLSAILDGTDWLGEGLTWVWAGESVQLTTTGTDRITAVGHRDAEGTAVASLTDTLPITVSLDDDSGWAVLYQGDTSSRSTGGTLVITEYTEGGELAGCVEFETDSGAQVTAGSFRADAL